VTIGFSVRILLYVVSYDMVGKKDDKTNKLSENR